MKQSKTVIDSYTRAEALADGVLVDLTKWATESGLKWHTACTDSVWGLITPSAEDIQKHGQSIEGRAWDTVWMLRHAIMTQPKGSSQLIFEVYYTIDGEQMLTRLKAHCDPGDHGEPVVTIMLPHED